jgi:hypothetical protein
MALSSEARGPYAGMGLVGNSTHPYIAFVVAVVVLHIALASGLDRHDNFDWRGNMVVVYLDEEESIHNW